MKDNCFGGPLPAPDPEVTIVLVEDGRPVLRHMRASSYMASDLPKDHIVLRGTQNPVGVRASAFQIVEEGK